jgi:3-phosphoshikimate 1-carboxyvinyltransferase
VSAVTVAPAPRGLRGSATVPGDKSIAHRVLVLGAVARGTTRLLGFPGGADSLATRDACAALGVDVETRGSEVLLRGGGWEGLRAPAATIDCRNSGTTMRLLAGVLAGRPFASRLDGDASLRRRPMRRVMEPLARMGATIVSEGGDGRAPLAIDGCRLHGAAHVLTVASAQVKSALLLAGLQADGVTSVEEPACSRDHTERLLGAFGAALACEERRVTVRGPQDLHGRTVTLPGDFSSAAFLIVAGVLLPGSELEVRGVGLNPTRTGLLDALASMGASLEVIPDAAADAEPRGTVIVRAARLRGATIGGDLLLRAIDEFPILCVAAACASGPTELTGAGELRVKESDRVATMATVLRAFGAEVEERPDGLRVAGGARLRGARVDPHGDHRVAMAAAVAALASEHGATIADAACTDVSFPGFWQTLDALRVTGGHT